MKKPLSIAIDGPAASGKTTIAEKLAAKFDYLMFDTGVMYRAVTLAALTRLETIDEDSTSLLAEEIKIDVRPPSKPDGRKYDILLDGEDVTWEIRKPSVNETVSLVSSFPGVRDAMTKQQRQIGFRGNVVMVGRDIGTVVLPEADIKIYLDASAEERAKRRYQEDKNRGEDVDYQEILESIKKRDQIDSTREVAPLKPAEDAVIINTDDQGIEEVFSKVLAVVNGSRD